MKKNKYIVPLILVFSLFFLWAISSNLLPTMIRQLMKTCELNTFEASFTETAYWLAYFIFPIPIAMFMKKYSYKAGIIFGLLLAAGGGLLFFPAAMLKEYWAYLCIFFIIATGMCFLETAANPYVTALGDPKTAPRRLNLAQSFNGLGAFISAMLLIAIAVIFVFSKLPKIGDEENKANASGEKLIDFGVLNHSHLRWGVIAQFFYNGGQTAINSLFLVYCCSYAGLEEDTATTFFGLYMLAFLLGRWIGTGLMVKFRPQDMLAVYAVINIILCGVVAIFGGMVGLYAMLLISFFMSIMYPTQFSLALTGLGNQTKSGSAFLVMSIVGNACLPQLTAYFMHVNEEVYHLAYVIPMLCFVFCAYYGWKKYKVVD